jgi:hypothetical protein
MKTIERTHKMKATTVHEIISLWPVLVATGGFVLAFLYGVKYVLPGLAKRIDALEMKAAEKGDLESAIDGFHTVCRFNQVSCQKENQVNTTKLFKELDGTLGEIFNKVGGLAVANAELSTKVEMMLKERENGNGNH